MTFLSIGDLALNFQNRRQTVAIKSDLARLTKELASGQKSDLSTLAGGDFAPITNLERSLKANAAYTVSTSEAALLAATMQNSLSTIQDNMTDLAPALLAAGNSEHPTMIRAATTDARIKFESVVAAFNTQVADRYAFSGAATDRPALADSASILSDLQATISSETTAAGIEAAIDLWFDTPGGGFDTIAYTGSTGDLGAFRLSETDAVDVALKASDAEVRTVLKGFALAALVGEGALNANSKERATLTRLAGEKLLSADSVLAEMRAEIGSAEARIDRVSARNAAEKSALEITRAELTSVDPYKAAVELEAVKTQLETIFAITVRLSRLSLSEFMR